MDSLRLFPVSERFLDQLVMEGRFSEAASLCPEVLRGSAPLWEWWIQNFIRLGQLPALLPHIPSSSPKLPPSCYDAILHAIIVTPAAQHLLLPTIKKWDPHLYSLSLLISHLEKQMEDEADFLDRNAKADALARVCRTEGFLSIEEATHSATGLKAAPTNSIAGRKSSNAVCTTQAKGSGDSSSEFKAPEHRNGRTQIKDGQSQMKDWREQSQMKEWKEQSQTKDPTHSVVGLEPGNLEEAMAFVYTLDHQYDKALQVYLHPLPAQWKEKQKLEKAHAPDPWPPVDVFSFIREHQLFKCIVHEAVPLLCIDAPKASSLIVDAAAHAPPQSVVEKLSTTQWATTISSTLHLLPPSCSHLLQQKGNPPLESQQPGNCDTILALASRYFLHHYLHALFEKRTDLSAPYQKLQVPLYAEFDRSSLMPFLRRAEHYRLQEAFQICSSLGLAEEQAFLLGRMGDYRRAMAVTLEQMHDVQAAVAFAREVADADVWEELFTVASRHPSLIGSLLEETAGIASPSELLQRIPPNTRIPGIVRAILNAISCMHSEDSLLRCCLSITQTERLELVDKYIAEANQGVLIGFKRFRRRQQKSAPQTLHECVPEGDPQGASGAAFDSSDSTPTRGVGTVNLDRQPQLAAERDRVPSPGGQALPQRRSPASSWQGESLHERDLGRQSVYEPVHPGSAFFEDRGSGAGFRHDPWDANVDAEESGSGLRCSSCLEPLLPCSSACTFFCSHAFHEECILGPKGGGTEGNAQGEIGDRKDGRTTVDKDLKHSGSNCKNPCPICTKA